MNYYLTYKHYGSSDVHLGVAFSTNLTIPHAKDSDSSGEDQKEVVLEALSSHRSARLVLSLYSEEGMRSVVDEQKLHGTNRVVFDMDDAFHHPCRTRDDVARIGEMGLDSIGALDNLDIASFEDLFLDGVIDNGPFEDGEEVYPVRDGVIVVPDGRNGEPIPFSRWKTSASYIADNSSRKNAFGEGYQFVQKRDVERIAQKLKPEIRHQELGRSRGRFLVKDITTRHGIVDAPDYIVFIEGDDEMWTFADTIQQGKNRLLNNMLVNAIQDAIENGEIEIG